MKEEQTQRKGIYYNTLLFKWYFQPRQGHKLDDQEKQLIFDLMSCAALEDIYIFTRFVLYIGNTRKGDVQEILYKIICHFLGTMWPDFVIANLHHFTRLGKKDDVLYFLQIPGMTAKVATWIKHEARADSDFQILLDGSPINGKVDRQIYYKPKLKSKSPWEPFLFKLIEDPIYNGITAGDLANVGLAGSANMEENINIGEPVEDNISDAEILPD